MTHIHHVDAHELDLLRKRNESHRQFDRLELIVRINLRDRQVCVKVGADLRV